MRTAEPSPADVADMELLRAAMTLEEAGDTHLGILPAIIGERRIILGASAIPGMDLPGLGG